MLRKSLAILGGVVIFTGFGALACGIFSGIDVLSIAVGAVLTAGGSVLVARAFGRGVAERSRLVK